MLPGTLVNICTSTPPQAVFSSVTFVPISRSIDLNKKLVANSGKKSIRNLVRKNYMEIVENKRKYY